VATGWEAKCSLRDSLADVLAAQRSAHADRWLRLLPGTDDDTLRRAQRIILEFSGVPAHPR
jgi:hypothetical protein